MVNIPVIKTIAFRIDEDLHTLIKLQATKERKTLQDYVIEVLKNDLEQKAIAEKNKNK